MLHGFTYATAFEQVQINYMHCTIWVNTREKLMVFPIQVL